MPGTSDNHASGIFVVKKDYQDFLDVIFVFNKTDALSINIGSIQESGVRSQNSEFRIQKTEEEGQLYYYNSFTFYLQ